MRTCKECVSFGFRDCEQMPPDTVACVEFELKLKQINTARIAKLVELIRRICEEAYNSEKPMQYHEMSQIEQLCDEIEKEAQDNDER